MANNDYIIPNWTTKLLESLTHAPFHDYNGSHPFLVIPIELEYGRGGRELAGFLAGELQP
jgi:hypothetical protein